MNPSCQCHLDQKPRLCHQNSVFIRHPSSGLVLDATDPEVKLQHFTRSCAQKWHLQCTELGRFIIVNQKNGKALDIENGAEEGANLITYPKHGEINQQWYINSDGTIECPCGNLVVNVEASKCKSGANIIAYGKHGGDNQTFQLQHSL